VTKPIVPDYELIRRIGGGAYGDVWLARSTATGVLRAAKIVWRHTFDEDRPFQREFEGIQHFERISREHPSQLALFHIGRNDAAGYFYYVMELADDSSAECGARNAESAEVGRDVLIAPRRAEDNAPYHPHTLRADLEHGRLPAARVVEIGLALTEALGHLHGHGLVHRDVKPSNVIFVNGLPKLADIGLVTDVSDARSIVGTEGYLPPEGPGTPQADIFALGKVLYEAATGQDRRQFPQLPPDLRDWPDSDQVFELNEILLKACASKIERRYQTCSELHTDLSLLHFGKSVRRKHALKHRWAVAKRLCVAGVIFGVLAAGAAILWRASRPARPLSANREAVRLYQQAVYEQKSETLDRLQQAYTNLTEAVRLDSGFLDAYYQMMESYFFILGDKLPPHYNQRANLFMVTEKLRQLNPNSARYHTVNSVVQFYDWKFEEAIAEAGLAIKLDPKLLRAHGLYAWYMLLARGDSVTALREYRVAEQIAPSDVKVQGALGGPFYVERKFDQAIKQFNKALQLEPRATMSRFHLACAYEGDKQYDRAIDEYENFDLLRGEAPAKTKMWYQRMRSDLHARGPRGWWQAQLDEARQNPSPDHYYMARLCARLGYINEVFSLLDRAYKAHEGEMFRLIEDDAWDTLRGDSRFQELMNKMGLGPKLSR
jgi:serine/threonine protein kinase